MTGLKTGVTYTVGVQQARQAVYLGDIGQARLEAPEGVDLAAANPVSFAVPLALGLVNLPESPDAPTGTAEPGPAPGEITLTWQPATTGHTDGIIGWFIYAEEQSTGDVTTFYQNQPLPADARSFTLTGLKTGVTWTVGVGAFRSHSGGQVNGDIAQARLEADFKTITLTLAESVGGSLPVVTVGYEAPDSNPLRDADMAMHPVPDFTGQPVTNNTSGDTTRPQVESVAMNGTTMTITFDERLDERTVPAPSQFTANLGGVDRNPTGVQIKRNVVTLTFAAEHAAVHGPTPIAMSYLAGTNPLRDLSNNAVLPFGQSATNNTPPAFASAEVNGDTLTITFNGALDADSVPSADAFTVTVGGDEVDLAAANPVSFAVPLAEGFVNLPESPDAPTGTAEPGPAPGEITLTWQPATTGHTDGIIGWFIYAEERSTGSVTTFYQNQPLPADARSFTLTGLKTGVTWTVGVGAFRSHTGGQVNGDIAQARLEADFKTVTLTLAESVGGSLPVVTVGYEAPDSNPLRDSDNAKNPVPNFAAQSVTNNTTGDTTPPEMVSREINGTTLTVTFDERLDESSVPPANQFTAHIGSISRSATGIQVDRNVVTLTFAAASHGQSVTNFRYDKPTGAGAMPLRDLSGNEFPTIDLLARLTVPNNTPPAFASAAVDGATLTITFNGALDPGSVPSEDAFTVTVAGSEVDLAATSPVSVSGSTVTLTLASAVTSGQTVTVGYAAPDSNPLRDADMAKNPVPNFTARSVTNNTP